MTNLLEVSGSQTEIGFVFLYNFQFCLDIFFFLGGFFMAWQILGRDLINNSCMKYVLLILYRYMRFLPLLFFVLIFNWQILVHMSNGPVWYFVDRNAKTCDSFYRNLLMFSNFYDSDASCCAWTWYV